MKWLCVTLLAMAGLVGCSNQQSASSVDPFFGQTRITAPPTLPAGPQYYVDPGYAPGQMIDSPGVGSVSPSVSGISVAPMGVPAGGAATQDKYSPPGGTFQYQGGSTLAVSGPGDQVAIPEAARQVPRWSSGTPVGRSLPMTPASSPSRLPASQLAPRPMNSRGAVDIMDLPPVDNSSRLETPAEDSVVRVVSDDGRRQGDVVRIPSYVEDGGVVGTVAYEAISPSASDGSVSPPTVTAASDRYEFAPDYRRLCGKLEYSEAARRWKLRYIPVDGATDDFGGSVVIDDSSRLSGFERGDFVEVHGTLGSTDADSNGFAPNYSVTTIERIEQ